MYDFLGIINVPIAEGEVGKDKRKRVSHLIYHCPLIHVYEFIVLLLFCFKNKVDLLNSKTILIFMYTSRKVVYVPATFYLDLRVFTA